MILRATRTNEAWEAETQQEGFPQELPSPAAINDAGVADLCCYILDMFYRGELSDMPYWCHHNQPVDAGL